MHPFFKNDSTILIRLFYKTKIEDLEISIPHKKLKFIRPIDAKRTEHKRMEFNNFDSKQTVSNRSLTFKTNVASNFDLLKAPWARGPAPYGPGSFRPNLGSTHWGPTWDWAHLVNWSCWFHCGFVVAFSAFIIPYSSFVI